MNKNIITARDIQSVNFRQIHMGGIALNTLYRSSHPIKGDEQEKIISLLAAKVRINAVLNLSDTNSTLSLKALFAPWYNTLYNNNKIIALGMDFSVTSPGFKEKLKRGLKFIINTEGPWLIHCHAGIDRTGFVCMVLESFMGSPLGDVINDYLLSYNSIFESSVNESQNADSLVAMNILSIMSNSQKINEQNLQSIAENYLRKTIGLSVKETELLKMKLSGNKL